MIFIISSMVTSRRSDKLGHCRLIISAPSRRTYCIHLRPEMDLQFLRTNHRLVEQTDTTVVGVYGLHCQHGSWTCFLDVHNQAVYRVSAESCQLSTTARRSRRVDAMIIIIVQCLCREQMRFQVSFEDFSVCNSFNFYWQLIPDPCCSD